MSDCDHVWAIFGIGAEARPGRCLKCGVEWEHPEIATLRTRAEQAEAERDAMRDELATAGLRVQSEYDRAAKAEAEVARLKRQIEEMQAFARDWRDGTATLIDEAEEAAEKSEGEIDLLRKVHEATKRYLDDGGAFAYDDMIEAIAMADRHFKET